MKEMDRVRWLLGCLVTILALSGIARTQSASPAGQSSSSSSQVYHRIEGRLQSRGYAVGNIRIRLLKLPDMRPITETFSRPEGQFIFSQVSEGEYIVETIETDRFESAAVNVSVRPLTRERPGLFTVLVDLSLKSPPKAAPAGVIPADVDLDVPKAAAKHYRAGMKAIDDAKSERAITELQEAVKIHPRYYAARLELGRELRLQKRFPEALEVLAPLNEIAPRHAEQHIERGIVLLSLERRQEAIGELETALRLDDSSWAGHLFLGWALLDSNANEAEPHFTRALAIDEQKAARAHLALARIADARGQRELALKHLDDYVALAPNAHDAEEARKLAAKLRLSH